jgi:GR25 family glycosyltransferase involved in LPS biosynthesis
MSSNASILNRFFEVRYINLDKRTDRKAQCEEELNRVGIVAERFKAYEGDNKHLAFNKSQWNCLNECKDKSILILEDDVVFTNTDILPQALSELPSDFDVVYFGANINGTQLERYSQHLFKIRNSFTTHAVGYSSKMAKWIVENFPYHTDEYEREGLTIYDEWLRVNVQEQFKCFLVYPMVAEQRVSYSDIWNCDADYSNCFKQGNELLSRL